MDINEFEVEFKSELEQGLDHAEWYQDQIMWMIRRIKQLEQRNKRISNTAIEQIDITQQRNEWLEKKVERYEKEIQDLKAHISKV